MSFRKIWILGFDIVHGCQLRCIGCPNSTLKPKVRTVKPDVFEACMRNLDVKYINSFRLFNFGEPLLHPDIPGLLEIIDRQKFTARKIEISTNGQHQNFDHLKEIFKTGLLGRMAVSCDGNGTPAEYEEQRPPAKWERLLEFLAKASEYRARYSPHTVLETTTICEDPEGMARWHSILDPLDIQPQFRGRWNIVDAEDFDESMDRGVKNEECIYLGTHRMYVDYNGKVGTCCQHPSVAVLGDLTKQTYSEIYTGKPRTALRKAMRTNRTAMRVCGVCMAEAHRPKMLKVWDKLTGKEQE